uniref:C-type lectin domain-containing protein n=1 Tax=Acrobeloides nanus TaxID=290746 RepID=A0A914DBT7_9BILA
MVNDYSYILGLHRNGQNKWVWFDYDGSELPLGNFTNWAPGYNENSSGDCVMAVSQNGTGSNVLDHVYRWITTPCYSGLFSHNFCQSLACDADFRGCIPFSLPKANIRSHVRHGLKAKSKKN